MAALTSSGHCSLAPWPAFDMTRSSACGIALESAYEFFSCTKRSSSPVTITVKDLGVERRGFPDKWYSKQGCTGSARLSAQVTALNLLAITPIDKKAGKDLTCPKNNRATGEGEQREKAN